MVGMGKLGLPVAVTIASKFPVIGYDINPELMRKRPYEHRELGPTLQDDFQKHFDNADLSFASLPELMQKCELIFVAVQTPHQPLYEGITRLPFDRADFDYRYLIQVAEDLVPLVNKNHTVVIISTVLPGTTKKFILPILGDRCHVVYNPGFVAMGQVMYDFLNPEFVLLGNPNDVIQKFYNKFDLPTQVMSIESAELTKISYNTMISIKVCYANTIAEICHKIPGCHHDEVIGALSKANKRLWSSKYLQGGMGDGCSCHPRDNIAMSWLAQKIDLSHNLFDNIMTCRENQTDWLADLMEDANLPMVILGTACKPETNITTGSPALLLANILKERGHQVLLDPVLPIKEPCVFIIGCKCKCYIDYKFPIGSIVIDPHRYIPNQEGVKIIRIGE